MELVDKVLLNLQRKADIIGFPIDAEPAYIALCAYLAACEMGDAVYDSWSVWQDIFAITDVIIDYPNQRE